MRATAKVLVLSLAIMLGTAGIASATPPGPNGRIAFRVNEHLATISPHGDHAQGLVMDDSRAADWSADGRRVAFCAFIGGRTFDIFTIKRDGDGRHRVTHNARSDECDPAWSPDMRWIAFTRAVGVPEAVAVIHPDGTALHRLINDGYHPQWSPDGRFIAFCRAPSLQAVYVMRPDGSAAHRVTPLRLDACAPDWSPSGARLVVTSHYQTPGIPSQAFTVHPDGSGLKQLTHLGHNGELDATWSPNGRRIVFASDREGGPFDLYAIRAGGGHRHRLTNTPRRSEFDPDWGPALT